MKLKRKKSGRRRFKLTKSFYKFLTFGIVMYAVFLLATVPANAVYSWFVDGTPRTKLISLSGVTGTVWSGSAGNATINGVTLGKLEWEMHFIPLLIGKTSFDIRFKSLETQGRGAIASSFGGNLYAHNFEFRAPLGVFAPLMYGIPVSFEGQLTGRIEDLKLEKGTRLNAKGRIVVSNTASVVPQRVEIGDMLIKVDPDDTGTRINLTDQGGPLQLQGNINVTGTGQYNVNMTLATRQSASKPLVQSLRFLGRADASGNYYFRKKGQLPGW